MPQKGRSLIWTILEDLSYWSLSILSGVISNLIVIFGRWMIKNLNSYQISRLFNHRSWEISQLKWRFIGIIFATFGFIVLLPVFLFVSIGLKLELAGPILQTTKGMTQSGTEYKYYKFRKRSDDEDQCQNYSNFSYIVRRTHWDELPLLHLLLKGEVVAAEFFKESVRFWLDYLESIDMTLK